MFVASFIVVELIHLPSRTSGSRPVPLGLLAVRNPDQESDLAALAALLDVCDFLLFAPALLTHFYLLIWTIEQLRLAGIDKMVGSGVQIPSTKLIAIAIPPMLIAMAVPIIAGLIFQVGPRFIPRLRPFVSEQLPKDFIYGWINKLYPVSIFFFVFIAGILVKRDDDNKLPWFLTVAGAAMSWYVVVIPAFLLVTRFTCSLWPIIGRALLIERREQDVSEEQQQQQLASGGEVSAIDTSAAASLLFFLTNLVVCVLWYAFMYDSTGTVNPAWTEVFG